MAEKKLARLAKKVGMNEDNEEKAAKMFIASIRNLNEKLGIPSRIEELREEDFEELANRAVNEGNPTYPVPEIWEKHDFLEFLGKIV